jgi:hypothetical protein
MGRGYQNRVNINRVCGYGQNSDGSAFEPMMCYCYDDDGLSGSVKGRYLPDLLGDYYLHKKFCVLWSLFMRKYLQAVCCVDMCIGGAQRNINESYKSSTRVHSVLHERSY